MQNLLSMPNESLDQCLARTVTRDGLDFFEKKRYAKAHQLASVPGFVVAITGTNGKGSTAFALEAIAIAHGISVMTFTSPHLVSVCERIRCQGEPIAESRLYDVLKSLPEFEQLGYFTALFFAFIQLVQADKPALVILEAGIGGALDATNIIDSDLLIITSVAYDHVALLGPTLADIAKQKAGLMRAKKPVIYAGDASLMPVIKAAAKQYRADLRCYGEDFSPYPKPTSLPNNVASAVFAACPHLPFAVNEARLHGILQTLRVPGRRELLDYQGVRVILDVAHNAEAISRLAQYLSSVRTVPCVALCVFKADKAVQDCLALAAPFVDVWHLSDINDDRVLTKEDLRRQLKQVTAKPVYLYKNPAAAFLAAIAERQAATILVFGSFTIVGAIYEKFHREMSGGL